MKHQDKVDATTRRMAALGVRGSMAAPLAWLLLRRMGLEVPPPLFIGFWPLAVGSGTGFALLFGLATFLLSTVAPVLFSEWSPERAGVVFGLGFASYIGVKRTTTTFPCGRSTRVSPARPNRAYMDSTVNH